MNKKKRKRKDGTNLHHIIPKSVQKGLDNNRMRLPIDIHNTVHELDRKVDKELVKKDGSVFSALPFEEALELLINQEKEQAKSIEKSKKQLLVSWKNGS